MWYNEYLRKGDESYEFYKTHHDDVLHVYHKDGEAIIFECLMDLIFYVFLGVSSISRIYVDTDELQKVYEIYDDIEEIYSETMNFNELKEMFNGKG